MILRNYYNILTCIILGNTKGPAATDVDFGTGSLLVGRMADGYKLGWPGMDTSAKSISLANITGINTSGICFGTSAVPVSFDDQTMGAIYENIAVANYNTTAPTYNGNSDKYEVQFSCVLTNKGNNTVTLTEMGISRPGIYYHYAISSGTGLGTSRNDNNVLVYREVLDKPITLAAGESVAYSHKFEVAIPEIS